MASTGNIRNEQERKPRRKRKPIHVPGSAIEFLCEKELQAVGPLARLAVVVAEMELRRARMATGGNLLKGLWAGRGRA
eukprot:g6879.t1